ncbi:MAG: hypothetical protein E7323_11450 [Clostridiales bacterium]|nr:hypothetical protein [Clostridiales bacterium]
MYPSEPPRRSLEEDSVPTDWSYVQSVEEGLRQRQAQNIGGRPEPRIRHRVVPTQSAGGPEVARSVLPAASEDSPFILPQRANRMDASAAGQPSAPWQPAASAPVHQQPDFAPENAQSQPEDAIPKATRTRRRAQIVTEDGSQFEKPAEIQIPEWLRVAQQNTTPDSVRRPPPPRVQMAPAPAQEQSARPAYGRRQPAPQVPMRQAEVYAAAGYPPELLAEQQRLDALQEAQMLRKRRGAMTVVPEQQTAPEEKTVPSYPPPRNAFPQRRALTPQETAARMQAAQQYGTQSPAPRQSGPYGQPMWQAPYGMAAGDQAYAVEEAEERPRIHIPWLGIITSILVLLSVLMWINRLNSGKELDKVYQARAAAQQQVADEHPYQYRELIEAQAEQYNLHPAFVASIVLNESSFRPHVKSGAEAMGLMQIRPDTGEYVNRALDVPGYNHDMLYDPETNIRFGCYYLGELSERFGGDPVLVAAAYNAGPTNVQNWLNNSTYSSDRRTLPIENIPYGDTQTYARRVLRDYAAYKRLYYEIPEAQ